MRRKLGLCLCAVSLLTISSVVFANGAVLTPPERSNSIQMEPALEPSQSLIGSAFCEPLGSPTWAVSTLCSFGLVKSTSPTIV
jgi:hypothetical protein